MNSRFNFFPRPTLPLACLPVNGCDATLESNEEHWRIGEP